MKTNFSLMIVNKIGMFFTLFLLALVLVSCSKKITFNTSDTVPAARGEVKVAKDDNDNYRIKLKVDYLAESNRLQPPANTYVVWVVSSENNDPINLGQIIGNSKLSVDFETVTASKPKKIFITAEFDSSSRYPSNRIVLETNNF